MFIRIIPVAECTSVAFYIAWHKLGGFIYHERTSLWSFGGRWAG